MKKIAVISAILENPHQSQAKFNRLISHFHGMVKGRMGVPLDEYGIGVIALTVVGELDEINSMTGKIGALDGVTVKTAISAKAI